jgi:hypothetical protein
VLGLGIAAGFDGLHGDFDVSDFVGSEGEQHEPFGCIVAYFRLATAGQEAVGSESEGFSVVSTAGCVVAIALLVVSVAASVSTPGLTSGLTIAAVVLLGPQQPPPQAMLKL